MEAARRLSPTIYQQQGRHLIWSSRHGIPPCWASGPHALHHRHSHSYNVWCRLRDCACLQCVCGFPAEIICALLQYVEIMLPPRARWFSECCACTMWFPRAMPCELLHAATNLTILSPLVEGMWGFPIATFGSFPTKPYSQPVGTCVFVFVCLCIWYCTTWHLGVMVCAPGDLVFSSASCELHPASLSPVS